MDTLNEMSKKFLEAFVTVQPMKTTTGRVHGTVRLDWDPNTLTVGGAYSLDSIVSILHKYIIQIKNTIEGDINEPDEAFLYMIARYLVRLYHPTKRPLTEPIKAVCDLLEDFEYEVTMIRWTPDG